MDLLKELFSNQFVLGLLLGLVFAGWIWKNAFTSKLLWKKEKQKFETDAKELQTHLHTQLKINSSGNDSLLKELENLRGQNETLRVNIATLQQKPGKSEIRHMHIMDAAVRMMREQAPGFAPAWEKAFRDAEAQASEQESGLRKLVRMVIPNISTSKTNVLTDSQSERQEP